MTFGGEQESPEFSSTPIKKPLPLNSIFNQEYKMKLKSNPDELNEESIEIEEKPTEFVAGNITC